MESFTETVKHHKLCAQILDLNKRQRKLWLQEWVPFEEADAEQVGTRANNLLGDL
jgi:hypothetical protein